MSLFQHREERVWSRWRYLQVAPSKWPINFSYYQALYNISYYSFYCASYFITSGIRAWSWHHSGKIFFYFFSRHWRIEAHLRKLLQDYYYFSLAAKVDKGHIIRSISSQKLSWDRLPCIQINPADIQAIKLFFSSLHTVLGVQAHNNCSKKIKK